MPINRLRRDEQEQSVIGFNLGKIRKGDKKPENEKRPGADLDFFRFTYSTPAIESRIAPGVVKLYGEQPAAFQLVKFPAPTVDAVWSDWLEEWSAGERLLRRCDGDNISKAWNPDAGRAIACNYPCQAMVAKSSRTPQCHCKAVGRLRLILPELIRESGLIGSWVLETHSEHDIVEIGQRLREAEYHFGALLERGLMDVPFILWRETRKIWVMEYDKTAKKEVRRERDKNLIRLLVHPAFVQQHYGVDTLPGGNPNGSESAE